MEVLVVGGGGREHALCWKIIQSPLVEKVYCAPGNAGIANVAECVDIPVHGLEGLRDFAKNNNIDLTVVGPELPLTMGIVDLFEKDNLNIFGPNMAASEIEGSKVFSKNLMKKYNIPTAEYESFSNLDDAEKWINNIDPPFVVKADGLAAGKGVIICQTIDEGKSALKSIMADKAFGEAGEKVVVEEFLKGEEASIFVITDGDNYIILKPSQDHKAIYDNDMGPNTGGMGAYCPAPVVSQDILNDVESSIIKPSIDGLNSEGIKYRGVLYIGLMIHNGEAKVLEYNCRFGDPETQPVLMIMESDIVPLLIDAANGNINQNSIVWKDGSAVCVVMSSIGYPGSYNKGVELTKLDNISDAEDMVLFHAGTKFNGNKIVTNGGRVLGLTALDNTIGSAIEKVYENISKIDDGSLYYRTDIGEKAL
jgi:phosphoribosylamine--glycine ligase